MQRQPRPGLSLIGGIAAAVLAVLLSIALYYVVGFPVNVPIAVGLSLVLAEVAEAGLAAMRHRSRSDYDSDSPAWRPAVSRALFHGVVAGLACWLGVLVADGLGLI